MSADIHPKLTQAGTYALVFQCRQSRRLLSVGANGVLRLAGGSYVYVGSAAGAGGLAARLRHHLRGPAHPHWHVDYLHRDCRLLGAWFVPAFVEHDWAQALAALDAATVPMPGFGASDCRVCVAHLVHFTRSPASDVIARALAGALRSAPAYASRLELENALLREPSVPA